MISPFRRLCHWGPIFSLVICASITIATISTRLHFLVTFLFQFSMCLCLYNMWCATLLGPGYYSNTITRTQANDSDNDRDQSQQNQDQRELSATNADMPSGRFCRRCYQIVLNKHHHCSWINNCVGQNNEHYFIRFLLFGILVSFESMVILGIDTYQRYFLQTYVVFNIFNIGLSLGVFLSLSTLLYMH